MLISIIETLLALPTKLLLAHNTNDLVAPSNLLDWGLAPRARPVCRRVVYGIVRKVEVGLTRCVPVPSPWFGATETKLDTAFRAHRSI